MNPRDALPASASLQPLHGGTHGPAFRGGQDVLENFFARWREAFAKACDRPADGGSQTWTLAGRQIRLRFAGENLRPILTPALAHLAAGQPDRDPDLEVLCWNGSATQVQPPELPWSWPPQWRGNAVYCPFGNELFQVTILSDSGDFALYRADTGQAIFWVRDARALPIQHYGAPLLVLFSLWANSRGLLLVHAGCVGTEHGAALLVGKGGSGKSTTCLLSAEAGLDYLSDDYCLVEVEPVPTAFALYSSGKLHRHMLPRFPRLAALAADPYPEDPSTKPVIFLRQEHGYAMTSQRPLRALIVPVVTGRPDTTFEPTSAAQALLALAPSTLYQLPNVGDGAFQSQARLVRALPCYRLNLGTRFETIPPAIRALLAGIP